MASRDLKASDQPGLQTRDELGADGLDLAWCNPHVSVSLRAGVSADLTLRGARVKAAAPRRGVERCESLDAGEHRVMLTRAGHTSRDEVAR